MANTTILVIEDDADARMMYAIMLRSWGYEVLEADSGETGIKLAQQHKPDLIILDIMMPDMDGYEVCSRLRSNTNFHRIPIIFLSALDAMSDRIKGYTTGADDFITKGQVDYRELGVRIQAALSRTDRINETKGPARKGSVIGLTSLRGGVGVSTIAVNLAQYAGSASPWPVMLIDMAFPVGSLSLWSGLAGPRHTVELLSRPPAEINLALIDKFSVDHVQGFRFIPGPSTLTDYSGIRQESVERMLNLLMQEGYFVILDMGRSTMSLQWEIPSMCDWIGIVTSADPTSNTLASVLGEALPHNKVDPRALLLIYNDMTNRNPVDPSIGLPRNPDVFIPYENDVMEPDHRPYETLWSLITPTET